MLHSRILLAASAILSIARAHVELKRAPFEAVGIEPIQEGFGAPVAENEELAAFAPPSLLGEKNATVPLLKDRSLELVDRQTCGAGFGYCASFGRCCSATDLCCAWGYCIEPADTCCPGNPCKAGWNCCGANCSPKGADCCYDGTYCEAGNMCVILGRTGSLVCCTDLSCTAAVVSGTTSYVTSTSRANPPSITQIDPPSITQPPPLTSQVITVGDTYTTYYWTVTWWYLSFYWTTFQRVESTVTYTRIYETTTFTTTATDEVEASRLFVALSSTLSFEPPPDAQTSLAALLNVKPSDTNTFSFDDSFTSSPPEETSSSPSSSSSTSRTSARTTSASTTATLLPGGGPGNTASGVFIQWSLMGLGALSGVLMLWL
ncbi:hypothetical protein K505DRAFT_406827 [Melanomma pulvis-pyrius CBS 109.77]|uniref:Carbohydrate-binding module family 18 protein n=1 Tax=Melanomma pulvis-pyrius CBS 109.77 TaxID=1314802 RepID=A0A6A6XHD2_9PLEO|nr:hypothetical protein K505DRAFT_406827 [Melanomma pulvis-pyrius CBS 109.77]